MANLNGIYGGLVEENRDQTQMGRLKVRVPAVYGLANEVPTDRLPWALPRGLPFGNTNSSGGMSWLPAVGDNVWVQFLDGEPEKPIWEWATAPVGKSLKLHSYDDSGPSRSILTRYGHSIQFSDTQVVLTTQQGHQLVIETSGAASGGKTTIQTPKGQSISLNDLGQNIVIQGLDSAVVSAATTILNAPTSTLLKTGRFSLSCGNCLITVQGNSVTITTGTGATIAISELGNVAITSSTAFTIGIDSDRVQIGSGKGTTGIIVEEGKISMTAPQFVMNTAAASIGSASGYPILLLTPTMLQYLLTHQHPNGNDGSPTGPPIPTAGLFPQDSATTRIQAS